MNTCPTSLAVISMVSVTTVRYAYSLRENKVAAVRLLDESPVSSTGHYLDTEATAGALPNAVKWGKFKAIGA